jgi:hypothetical protein
MSMRPLSDGEYLERRVKDLEHWRMGVTNHMLAVEQRVVQLEGLVVSAASDVIKLEDKIAELERWKHDIEQFSEEIKRSALTRHMGDKT